MGKIIEKIVLKITSLIMALIILLGMVFIWGIVIPGVKRLKSKYVFIPIEEKYSDVVEIRKKIMNEIRTTVNHKEQYIIEEEEKYKNITEKMYKNDKLLYEIKGSNRIYRYKRGGGAYGYPSSSSKPPPIEKGYIYDENGNLIYSIYTDSGILGSNNDSTDKIISVFHYGDYPKVATIVKYQYDVNARIIKKETLFVADMLPKYYKIKKIVQEYKENKLKKETVIECRESDGVENKVGSYNSEEVKEYDDYGKIIKQVKVVDDKEVK